MYNLLKFTFALIKHVFAQQSVKCSKCNFSQYKVILYSEGCLANPKLVNLCSRVSATRRHRATVLASFSYGTCWRFLW